MSLSHCKSSQGKYFFFQVDIPQGVGTGGAGGAIAPPIILRNFVNISVFKKNYFLQLSAAIKTIQNWFK